MIRGSRYASCRHPRKGGGQEEESVEERGTTGFITYCRISDIFENVLFGNTRD